MARIPAWALKPLARRAIRLALGREPDHVIGGRDDPYLERWFAVPRNRWFNVYVHRFCRSDDDRALHDHPWVNCSVLLEGSYVEHTDRDRVERLAGEVKFRTARAAHRIELDGIFVQIGLVPNTEWLKYPPCVLYSCTTSAA